VLGFLIVAMILSFFLAVYKDTTSPPSFNADEAAFGYNSYSILHTGADEYGTVLPVRLKSFGDYKMPLYSYLSVPFVWFFGLNELGVRSLNIFFAVLFPLVMYLFAKELFQRESIGVISAFLISVSLGKGIIERHAHEALLATFLITLASYFFLKAVHAGKFVHSMLFVGSLFLALFSYQSSRLYAVVFVCMALFFFVIKKTKMRAKSLFLIIFMASLVLFAATDIIYKPARVGNLLLTSNPGFSMQINQLRAEGGNYFAYNKVTIGIQTILHQYLQYFSPQFLAVTGDTNPRFGFLGMSPMTPIEYLFLFIGIYFLIKNKERYRYYLLILFFVSPLTAAFSWQESSLTRSFFLLIPSLLLSAYGVSFLLKLFAKRSVYLGILSVVFILEGSFLFFSWDFYLNHYPKRAIVTRAWQSGYKELSDYVKKNYNKTDTFYITQKNGEPYIFMLYYLQYPPQQYQKQARLTAPDVFGFGQVEKFDKFNFSIPQSAFHKNHIAIIGYPDDFDQLPSIDKSKIKKIIINHEEIFWIYETN
jgi:4-amino-4-deoxy-L-arabinose transferase-like glycosyltransferase